MAIYIGGKKVAGFGGRQGEPGKDGVGVPAGGKKNQVLGKASDNDFDTKWIDQSGGVAGVTRFNGRTGAVTPKTGDYTAEQVGARPNTWMPSAADVGAATMEQVEEAIQNAIGDITSLVSSFNGRTGDVNPAVGDYTAAMVGARPDTWMPTAADVGAATNADIIKAIQAAVFDSWEGSY